MGEVYRADDLKVGQVVALRFRPLAAATDPSKLARLFAEARRRLATSYRTTI